MGGWVRGWFRWVEEQKGGLNEVLGVGVRVGGWEDVPFLEEDLDDFLEDGEEPVYMGRWVGG